MKILYSLVITCISVMSVIAQPVENALLWKVSGNGLTQASYLYGTIHLACDLKISDEVTEAFETSQQLALEINMADPSMMMTMMQNMYMAEGKTLADFTSDEELNQLKNYLDGKVPGVNFAMMKRMKPFFLSSMAMTSLLTCSSPQGYDMYFLEQAKSKDYPIIGLEKLQDQLDMIDKVPYKDQVKDLLTMTSKSEKENSAEFDEMLRLYEAKDLNGLMNYMTKEESSMTLYEDDFLGNRNKNWIPVITKNANTKSTFFAFGAAHLAGDKGVVNLLRQQGYKVEPIE